ncbi:response regulator [Orrella sp. JC864]|uniref:response regulator n=1 Tax=Orrella sp. JC864 TaxID=3120298 RepID=UPI0012BCD3DE
MNAPDPMRVLIVDDNELASELLSEFITLLGHRVSVAGSGEQAMEKSAQENPDIVIVDIILPDLDGYELAARLRKQREAPPRIVALSGLPKSMQREQNGMFDAWLEKPVDLAVLENMLAQTAQKRSF